MLVMAIEAVKLLTDTQKTILGYELRDVAFKTALLVPDNERGVETHFFLRRQPDSTGRDGTWSDFRLCAFLNNEWTEVCNGSIRVDHAVLTSGQWTARAAKECIQETQAHYLRIESKSGSALDMDTFYSQLWQYGLDLCRTFRTVKSARCAGEECTAAVGIHQGSDYTVHPCTLDALLHMPMISYTRDSGRPKSTAITSKIDHVWIASSGLGWQATDLFHAVATLVTEDRRGCEARCQALSTDGTHMLADLEGMRFTVVSSRAEIVDRVEGERDLPWNLVWEPDITLMTPLEFDEYYANLGPRNEGSMGFYRDLEFLHYSYLKQILADVAAGKTAPQPCHLLKYLRWAKEQVKRMESGQTPHWEAAWESLSQDYKHRQAVEKRLEQANAQSICHVAVARHLQETLRGTIDPLELLFGSSILKDLYSEACNNQGFDRLNRFLRLYSHKHANIRYLEVGAGTGAATAQVLPSLVGGGKPEITGASYLDFTYTDISEQFFGPAKARFAQYPDLAFQRLDIEKPLASQGYSPESYDMIIAANVLHATKDLLVTLRAVNWLLRPGGKLVLFEIVNADLGRTGFIMGLLSGWWLSTENYRTRGPCLSTSAWNTLLKQAGFSGVEHEFQDHPNHRYHESSVLISTKNPSSTRPPPSLLSNAVNIATGTPILEAHYANSLQAQLSKEGVNSTLVPMDRIHGASLDVGALTIVTADLDLGRPFLHHLSSEDFSALQHLVRQSQNLVWLTPPVNDGSSAPEYNMITGLARVCPEEVEGQKFMRVGIETGVEPTPRQIKDFLKTIHQLLAGPPGVYEMEFEQRGGLFHIPRLRLDTVCQEALYQIQTSRAERDLAWRDAPPLKLITETPGILDSLTFVDDENFRMPLAQDEVEIQVYAVGLTFKDCLTALGRVPGETHGNECAGIVVRRGSACEKAYQIGDRVCMLTREALKTYARSKVQCVCPLPTNMSFVEGAAFPWNFVMAWTSLVDIGRLSKGERVLIHAAAGGTGQAAVQISQHLGAEIFVTVGSEVKKRLLMNEYHIPEDHIFYSRDTSFATDIRIATQGRGVDVVLNSLSGDGLMESVGCLGPYGRFVEIGKQDIQDNTRLPMRGFNKGISFSVFDGSLWVAERPHQVEHAMQTIMDLFQQGVFHLARPLRTFSVSNIHLAFTLMAQGQASGKTVIEIAPSAVVPAVITYRPNYVFPANATYVLAGGFGGIGRTIARWMVDRGARHLLIISRSGSKTPEAACLVDELRNAGINVQAPPCDISDPGTLKRVLEEYRLTMPPIRGCVQASMVLQDALYSSMAHSQWTAAVNPKVDGSRNLDVLLPAGMDFFILLASTAGIVGQRGQSNYAAGNTYQDSLARHRITRGESAISIDLGLMVDDGYLTRNQMTLDRLLARGSLAPITRAKFLSLMEYYCDPAHSPTFTTCQMVFGLNSSEAIHSRGLDEPSWMQRPMFGFLHRIPATGRRADTTSQVGSGGHRSRDFRADLVRAQSLDDAALVVAEGLIAKLVNILSGLEEQDVDKSKSIVSYGLDSLVAVEIRGWFAKVFQADIPTFEILGGLSFERLGRLVAVRSQLNRDWVV